MLLYFKVGNYMSIKEPLTLNFEAAKISDLPSSKPIEEGDSVVLRSILLYGHNASGKSNILKALVHFRWLITKSATEMNAGDEIRVTPFLLDKTSEEKPSFFEVGFILKGVRYRYGIEVTKETVQKEWLLEAKKKKYYPLFLRKEQEFEIDDKRFIDGKGIERRTRKNALYLTVAAQWNVSKAERIVAWFDGFYTIHGLNDMAYRTSTVQLFGDPRYAPVGKALLKAADLGINGVEIGEFDIKDVVQQVPEEVRERMTDQLSKQDRTIVFVKKDVYENGEKIGERPFLLDQVESDGTIKLFNLIGAFVAALLENRVVVIDEFDARLHTLLTKAVLQLFNSGDLGTSAQLLLACHDTALIDKELLRRDQIYFVEKDRYGATKVSSLVEYKPRKETAFEKNYLNGKYGGIPILSDLKKAYHAKAR